MGILITWSSLHQFNTRRKTVFCLQGNSVVYIIRVKEKQNDIIINKISSSFLKKKPSIDYNI